MDERRRLARAYRAILVLAVAMLGLAAAWVHALTRAPPAEPAPDLALFDPDVRREAVQELVGRGEGHWDSFPDADVARLLQPGLVDPDDGRIPVVTNPLGLRERPFVLQKPDGITRVVLLGDSYVMGFGVRAEERAGVFLEQMLAAQSGAAPGAIECLHFGANSWNLVAECAFLRRQISLLRPDLVIQVAVHNDLEDVAGVRGMGVPSSFAPRRPERADVLLVAEWPLHAFGTRRNNWLAFGLDGESRARFEEAGREVGRLARAVTDVGGRYLLLDHWIGLHDVAQRFLARELAAEQTLVLPSSFGRDLAFRNSKSDPHWNRAGHEEVARVLFAVIRRRNLLPQLTLAALPEADATAERLIAAAAEELAGEPPLARLLRGRRIDPAVDFARIDDDAAAQVHGGIVRGGLVSAYASVILRCEGRRRLRLEGAGLGRSELHGVTVSVFVDEHPAGALRPAGDAPFDSTFELPDAIASRTFVSVRLAADDYAYALPDLRSCQVLRLARIALE